MTGKTIAAVRMAAATGATIITSSQEAADRTNRIARDLGLTVKVVIVGPAVAGTRPTAIVIDDFKGRLP